MKHSILRQFYGETYQTTIFDGLTATETEYDYRFIDWHHHENPYFAFILEGNCCHINKREKFECSPDSLLFHNCQESHYNTKKDGVSRTFQLELSRDWCDKYEINLDKLPNSLKFANPNAKLLFYNIYKEIKLFEDTSNITIDALLLQTFEEMQGIESITYSIKPKWVKKIDEILHDNFDQPLTLLQLSDELNVHSVHLSRDFSRYFRCNFSEYIRKIRVEKSLDLLRKHNLSLTEIALMCGFADQSHFIRSFKSFYTITPKKFRQLISLR